MSRRTFYFDFIYFSLSGFSLFFFCRFNGHKVTIQVNHDAPPPHGPLDDSFSSEPPGSPDARWRGGKETPRKQVGGSTWLHLTNGST